MMDLDTRAIFEKWMDGAYKLERDKCYALALNKYKDAYELAIICDDSAKNRAFEGIERCKNFIKKDANDKKYYVKTF